MVKSPCSMAVRHFRKQVNSFSLQVKATVDIVLAPVTNMNGYFTGTSPSFAGLANKPVVSR